MDNTASPRKRTVFSICTSHAGLFAGRQRTAEIFAEGGPATAGPCTPGAPCKIRPGTDLFVAHICRERDWFLTTEDTGVQGFFWDCNNYQPQWPTDTYVEGQEPALDPTLCPACEGFGTIEDVQGAVYTCGLCDGTGHRVPCSYSYCANHAAGFDPSYGEFVKACEAHLVQAEKAPWVPSVDLGPVSEEEPF